MSSKEQNITHDWESQREAEIEEGGTMAWLTVLGAWLVMFATFGRYLFSFGVYQDYYTRFFLSEHSASKIGWIGSFQLMMPFACGVISGKLFDSGYFHATEIFGSSIFTLSLFLLSLAEPQQYRQVFLSQGLGMGIGLGFTFIPTVSIAVHHFNRRKVHATGIIMSGSSLGGVVFPIMLNNLIGSIGFAKAVRATGFVVLGALVLGNCLMRTAYSKMHTDKPRPDIKSFFTDIPYLLSGFASLISLFGFYFPVMYLQLYAVQHGIDENLAFYSIATMNAASTVGRVLGNYVAQVYGPYTTMVPCTLITGASIFAVRGVHNSASLIAVSIFYGFFAGAWLSISVATLGTLARHPHEVGARIGIALAFGSFATLGAAPVQGALLTSEFIWSRPIIFSGVLMIAAALVIALARRLLSVERGTQKV